MRYSLLAWVVSFASLSCAAYAERVHITPNVIQKGFFRDASCQPAPDSMFDDCACESDQVLPRVTGLADENFMNLLNAEFETVGNISFCEGESAEADESKSHNEYKVSYEVTYNDGVLLAVSMNSYSFTGGAHGNPSQDAIIADIAAAKILILDDIIAPEKQPELQEYLFKALEKDYADRIYPDSDMMPKNLTLAEECGCFLSLDDKGLRMVFNAYAVGPYSSGMIEVPIPTEFIDNATIRNRLNQKK